MYFTPPEMCWDILCADQPVQLNPDFDNYNVDHVVDNLKNYVETQRVNLTFKKVIIINLASIFGN